MLSVHVDPPRSTSGEFVTFSVTALDNADPSPEVTCNPPSGSFVPRGTTLVTCTVTDRSGNEATATFPVIVRPKATRSTLRWPRGEFQGLLSRGRAALELDLRQSPPPHG